MTLEAVYYFSQIVAVIAILASLVFVGIQIRQSTEQAKRNEAATRSAAAQSVHENFASWYLFAASNQYDVDVVLRGLQDPDQLNDEESALFMALFQALFSYSQNAFYMWHEGHLRDEIWNSWAMALVTIFSTPGGQVVWKRRRFAYTDAFGSHVENHLLNQPLPESARPWVRTSAQQPTDNG